MTDYREILYEVDEQIATVTFNRPEHRNPISVAMLGEVRTAVHAAQQDDDVRVLVITGAGKAFCSGGDVKSMADVAGAGGRGLSERQEQVGFIQETQLLLRRFPKVLIAAVNGAAYGAGLDLACAADFRLASDTARFCEVYVRLGLAPGGGGAWLLPRIVGLTNALDLILSGEPIDAQTALSIGLVSRVVPADTLPDGHPGIRATVRPVGAPRCAGCQADRVARARDVVRGRARLHPPADRRAAADRGPQGRVCAPSRSAGFRASRAAERRAGVIDRPRRGGRGAARRPPRRSARARRAGARGCTGSAPRAA